MEAHRRKILVFLILLMIGAAFYFFVIKIEKSDLHREKLVLDQLNSSDEADHSQISPADDLPKQNLSMETLTEQAEIPIHIMGEVKKPGVYRMSVNALVQDAIERAGGLTDEADLLYINLAAKIEAHQKIFIPSKAEIEQNLNAYKKLINQDYSSQNENSALIDLNTADKQELMRLNGIGESKADAIIAYREEYGRFSKIEDIMNVPGIKDSSFKKIKDQIIIH